MFTKIKNFTKSTAAKIKSKIVTLNAVAESNNGEMYIDTAVKIVIGVVLGILLLGLLVALFGDTIMPEITDRITGMFDEIG